MVRRLIMGALVAVIAGWLLATVASGSPPRHILAGAGQMSELTSPSRACTPHGSWSVHPDRWTARRKLTLHTSLPLARIAVCRRIAA
jgi:hypothetical protein